MSPVPVKLASTSSTTATTIKTKKATAAAHRTKCIQDQHGLAFECYIAIGVGLVA